MKSKLEIAGSLAHEIDMPAEKKKFVETALKEAAQVSEERNVISHRLIGLNKDKGFQLVHKVARGKEVKELYTPISINEVKELVVKLGVVNMKLLRIVIGDEPWKKK